MNLFSLAFCAFLLVKGLTRPSTTDSGSSGNWVIDFYWCVGVGRVVRGDLFVCLVTLHHATQPPANPTH